MTEDYQYPDTAEVEVQVNMTEVVHDMVHNWDHDQVMNFIMHLDNELEDLDFTAELIQKLLNVLLENADEELLGHIFGKLNSYSGSKQKPVPAGLFYPIE